MMNQVNQDFPKNQVSGFERSETAASAHTGKRPGRLKIATLAVLFVAGLGSNSCIRTTCLGSDPSCGGTEGLVYTALFLSQNNCSICDLFFFFATSDGTNYSLYSTDGKSVTLIKSGFVQMDNLRTHSAFVGNKYLFIAGTVVGDIELWITDGTGAGTRLVKDINPGTVGSQIDTFTVMNDKLYFYANDGTNGRELWVSDGTANGTKMLYDLASGATSGSPVATLTTDSMAVLDNTLYFRGVGTGPELFASKGIPGVAPTQISAFNITSSKCGNVVLANNTVYFSGGDSANSPGVELYSYTPGGNVALVSDYNGGAGNALPVYLTPFGGKLFMQATDAGTNGTELTFLDLSNTAAGVTLYANIATGATNSTPKYLTGYNDKVFFAADDSTGGTDSELWSTNSMSVPSRIKDIFVGSANPSFPQLYDVKSGLLFFAADDGTNGKEIWVTDGTTAGTRMLFDAFSGSVSGVF